eukprot:9287767-Pyramimonas_sp.AAC.1
MEETHVDGSTVAFGGAPNVATKRCTEGETHEDFATGAFSGVPYWTTKRCTGRGRRMWMVRLRPPAEFPMEPRSAVLGGGNARERVHQGAGRGKRMRVQQLGHSVELLMGPRSAVLGGG